jgi:hypothetical protein
MDENFGKGAMVPKRLRNTTVDDTTIAGTWMAVSNVSIHFVHNIHLSVESAYLATLDQ